jgi:hypothetical protein
MRAAFSPDPGSRTDVPDKRVEPSGSDTNRQDLGGFGQNASPHTKRPPLDKADILPASGQNASSGRSCPLLDKSLMSRHSGFVHDEVRKADIREEGGILGILTPPSPSSGGVGSRALHGTLCLLCHPSGKAGKVPPSPNPLEVGKEGKVDKVPPSDSYGGIAYVGLLGTKRGDSGCFSDMLQTRRNRPYAP